MRYNPNSKFQTSINTFFTFIFLNLLFLFLSIPIFTIGITTTALMSSMIKFANEGDDRIIKNFFEYIKKDWYKSSISFFLLIIIIFIFLFSTFFG